MSEKRSLSDFLSSQYGSKKSKSKKTTLPVTPGSLSIIDDSTSIFSTNKNNLLTKKLGTTQKTKKPKSFAFKNLASNELGSVRSIPEKVTKEIHTDTTPAKVEEKKNLMKDGSQGGLQSVQDLKSQLAAKNIEEEKFRQEKMKSEQQPKETIYRDEKGRKIQNYQEYKQSKVLEEQRKEREKEQVIVELNKGEIQKAGLERATKSTLKSQRNALEDPLLNVRTSDPSYEKKQTEKLSNETPTTALGRKVFTGIGPVNRFNILPGWRWDGVLRSNNFELKYFNKRNELKEKEIQSYTMKDYD